MSIRRLAAIALLVCATCPALGKSGDSELSCPLETRHVTYSDLVFCWPVARTDAGFGFTSPDLMQGYQWWIGRRRIAEGDLKELPDEQRKVAVLATFVVVPARHSLIKSHWVALQRSQKIKAEIEALKPDSDGFSVTLYQGEKFGEQRFDFHKVGSTHFSSEKQLASNMGLAEQVGYWVSMTAAGHVDYIMSCVRRDRVQTCSSRFLLSQNLVGVSVLFGDDAESARAAFEDLRGQIRSYLVSPDLDAQ